MIEVGARAETSNTIAMRFGDASGTDLTETEGVTADNNPWIELSQTLVFWTGSGMLMGVG